MRPDDRGVSEGMSVAALVLLTVVVTASVGIGVLLADEEGENNWVPSFPSSTSPTGRPS